MAVSTSDQNFFNLAHSQPDISATHYKAEHWDQAKAVNEQIDENQKDLAAHFDHLGRMYSDLERSKQDRYNKILPLLKQAKQTYIDFKEFDELNKKVSNFRKDVNANRFKEAVKNGDVKLEDLLENIDPDMSKEAANRLLRNSAIAEGNDIAGALEQSNPDLSNEISDGPEGAYRRQIYQAEDIKQALENEPLFRARLESTLKVRMRHLETKGGPPVYMTYDQAVTESDKAYIDRLITAAYAYENRDVVGGRMGRYKREFLLKLLNTEEKRRLERIETQAQALKEVNRDLRYRDLATKLIDDPTYAVDYVNLYKGYNEGSFALAKAEMAEMIADMAKEGYLNEGQINKILDQTFLDHNGKPVIFKEYWKKEAQIIRKGLAAYQTAEFDAQKSITEAKNNALAVEIFNKRQAQKTPVSIEERNADIAAWMEQTGITDPRLVPDVLKNMRYAGIESDVELDQRLKSLIAANGYGILTEKEIMAFEDPDYKLKYRKMLALRGEGAVDSRKSFLTKMTDSHFVNKLGEAGRGTEEWYYTHKNIQAIYAKKYEEVLSKTGSHAQAEYAAEKDVLKSLQEDRDNKYNLGEPIPVPQDQEFIISVAKARAALVKNPELRNSSEPWIGEEKHLKTAAELFAKKNMHAGNIPEYYRQFTNIKLSPVQLVTERLKATGILKDNKIVIPEKENLKRSDSQLLLNRPSASRTYRVTQNNEDYIWMLDQVKNEDAIANGGYDAIKDKDGEYVELPKPLTQHTVAEILGLIQQGYNDFGIYDLTASGLMDVLQANNVSLDTVFDVQAQDQLILGRLRYKAEKANQYHTINQTYRRLVNIDRADHEEFLQIVGELPPYLQLPNLLPAVAKEMVKQTLQ